MVPMPLGEEQKRRKAVAIGIQQRQRLRLDRIAQLPPLPVEGIALTGQLDRLPGVVGREQLHHQAGIAQPAHRVDPGRDLKADGIGAQGRLLQAGELLQSAQPLATTAMERGQTLAQPAAIGSRERCHIGDGANTEQIARRLDRLQLPHRLRERMAEHIGEPHPGQTAIGRRLGGGGRMDQSQSLRWRGGQGVVVREDHLHTALGCSHQRFSGGDPVVDRDQQADPLTVQALDHARVQAIPIVHTTGDRRHRIGTERAEGPDQKGGAGHSIGVVIAADRHRFSAIAGPAQATDSNGELGEVLGGPRERRHPEQILHLGPVQAAPGQHRP